MKRFIVIFCALCFVGIGAFAQSGDWKTIVSAGWSPEHAPMGSISHGKWFDNHFFLGMGLSFGESGGEYFLPATYIQGRIKMGRGWIAPYLDNKIGVYGSNITNLDGLDGLYWQPTIGVEFKWFSLGLTGMFLQGSSSYISGDFSNVYQNGYGALGAVVEFSF